MKPSSRDRCTTLAFPHKLRDRCREFFQAGRCPFPEPNRTPPRHKLGRYSHTKTLVSFHKISQCPERSFEVQHRQIPAADPRGAIRFLTPGAPRFTPEPSGQIVNILCDVEPQSRCRQPGTHPQEYCM